MDSEKRIERLENMVVGLIGITQQIYQYFPPLIDNQLALYKLVIDPKTFDEAGKEALLSRLSKLETQADQFGAAVAKINEVGNSLRSSNPPADPSGKNPGSPPA